MHRFYSAAWAVSIFALVAGCSQQREPGPVKKGGDVRMSSATTLPMPDCEFDTSNPIGVVRIKMPDEFNLKKIDRIVKQEKGKPKPSDGKGDAGGANNYPKPGFPEPVQPFNIYLSNALPALQDSKNPVTHPYILVRVIIQDDSSYKFYFEKANPKGIQGVGTGPAEVASRAICGVNPILPQGASGEKESKARHVASFFIDVDKMPMGSSANFNIGIIPKVAEETLIFIDPKVHNEG